MLPLVEWLLLLTTASKCWVSNFWQLYSSGEDEVPFGISSLFLSAFSCLRKRGPGCFQLLSRQDFKKCFCSFWNPCSSCLSAFTYFKIIIPFGLLILRIECFAVLNPLKSEVAYKVTFDFGLDRLAFEGLLSLKQALSCLLFSRSFFFRNLTLRIECFFKKPTRLEWLDHLLPWSTFPGG